MIKPKLLVLTSSYPDSKKDNSGVFLHELAKRLKDNFEVLVLTPLKGSLPDISSIDDIKIIRHNQSFTKRIKLAGDGPIMSKLRKNKFYWLSVPSFILLQFIGLKKIVSKENISLIHAHWIIPQGLVAVMYKKLINRKIKILVTIHGTDFNDFSGYFSKSLIRFVLNNVDELTVVSGAIKEGIVKLGYDKQVNVHPMGLDVRLFNPDKKSHTLKSELGITGPFILFVGSLVKKKGIEQLIEAVPEMVRVFGNMKLVVVGHGNIYTKLIERVNDLHIDQSVVFMGEIPNNELPKYFATADLFILPSFSEGFSVSIMEALCSETLVLTSPLKALRDLVTENETGFVLKEITSSEIARKAIQLLKKHDKLEEVKINGRKRVVENYDWKIVNNNYSKLLLGMLKLN